MNDITELLQQSADGDKQALSDLFEATESDLKRIALQWLRRYSAEERVRATDVIDRAFMKLMSNSDLDWEHRRHFFGFASRNIKHVIIDLLRRKDRDKPLQEVDESIVDAAASRGLSEASFVSLQQALEDLGDELSDEHRTVIELRFFGECTFDEVSSMLDADRSKVVRMSKVALAFLKLKLNESFSVLDLDSRPPNA